MDDKFNICELADEIIVHILSYLPAWDVLNISTVSRRFHDICSEKAVVRHLDFQRCYQLGNQMLVSFFEPKVRCINIHILNLNHCYWISSAVLSRISKLKNLKELHVLECSVSLQLLKKFLSSLHLNALSWTWQMPTKDVNLLNDEFKSIQNSLVHLNQLVLYMNNIFHLSQIYFLIQYCPHLDCLEIYKTRFCTTQLCTVSLYQMTADVLPAKLNLQRLKKLKIQLDVSTGASTLLFARELLSNWINSSVWEELWLSESGSGSLGDWCQKKKLSIEDILSIDALSLSGSKNYTERILRPNNADVINTQDFALRVLRYGGQLKCRKLSVDFLKLHPGILHAIARQCPLLESLSMHDCILVGNMPDIIRGLKDICDHCRNITSLDLALTNIFSADENPCLALTSLTNLRCLSMPASLISLHTLGVVASKQSWKGVGRAPRSGISTATSDTDMKKSKLWQLTESCPHIAKLEIVGDPNSYRIRPSDPCMDVDDASLKCISRWKKLQHLSLTNLHSICYGNFLCDIFQNCSELKSLKLKNVGSRSSCVYITPLLQSLNFASSLKDLSIFQTNIDLTSRVCQSLEKCKKLERLCIFGTNLSHPTVADDICHLVNHLPKLIVIYLWVRSSGAVIKVLNQKLASFLKARPAFSYMVQTTDDFFKETVLKYPTLHLEEMTLFHD